MLNIINIKYTICKKDAEMNDQYNISSIKAEAINIFTICINYMKRFVNDIKSYISPSFIVLGLLAILHFMWAGIGIVASVAYALILLFILYYSMRYKNILQAHLHAIFAEFLPDNILKYISKYFDSVIYSIIFIIYVYFAIILNIMIAWILKMIFYIFIFGTLFVILYEMWLKYKAGK